MEVDGEPNARVCRVSETNARVVHGQNCFPSLRFDLGEWVGKIIQRLPTGFYYKFMTKPPRLNLLFNKLLAHMTGLGRLPEKSLGFPRAAREELEAEVLVVGGGLAGLAAAAEAEARGAEVVLVEELELGGWLNLFEPEVGGAVGAGALRIRELMEKIRTRKRIRVLMGVAVGAYEDNLLAVAGSDTFYEVRYGQMIVASGGYERLPIFEDNDRPGIMLSTGALKLAREGLALDKPVVVVDQNGFGAAVARQLKLKGIEVETLVRYPGVSGEIEPGCDVIEGKVVRAEWSGGRLRALKMKAGEELKRIICGTAVFSSPIQPSVELAAQAGAEILYEPLVRGFVPRVQRGVEAAPGVYVAGVSAGFIGVKEAELSGRVAAVEACRALGLEGDTLRESLRRGNPYLGADFRAWADGLKESDVFICLCLDVTLADLRKAVEEGYGHPEKAKRYLGVMTGPCQGKLCMAVFLESLARLMGKPLKEMRVPTLRPPVKPVPVWLLAGEEGG